ncbi:ABC transporter permease [Telmatospirillum sp. J64-1]|uniref:ABC transporter permease n=1 Tax=Telmatospirillum sp. J64-1 TaxID=2502183 RepID=UPI00163DCFEF|nr:ABC transporter permease [Telmatospirillum sp. J64-1]
MKAKHKKLLARTGATVLITLILLFVSVPSVVVIMSAFNSTAILSFPPQDLSLRWFERAVTYRDFQRGFINGLIVTAWTSGIALVIGTALAYAIDRFQFRGKDLLETILLSPLVIPHFTIGLGVLMLASQVSMRGSFATVILAQVILVLPFVLRSVYVSLRNLDRRYELAAASLGASPLQVLLRVDLPLLLPGMFGGWLFAAILSFNEFSAALFVTSHATQTLPVAMYTYVREYTDPTMAAISTIFIVTTSITLVLANRFLGLRKVLAIEESK